MTSLRAAGPLFTLVIACAAVTAYADNTVVSVAKPDYGYLRGNDAFTKVSNRQAASHKKQARSLVMVIKCEHYVTALITYDDGTLEHMDLRHVAGNEVDRAELTAYQTAVPNLHVVDDGCK